MGQRRNGTSTPLFIMNSAGEEDEEQVDYAEDSGGENSMSFNGQARSTTWRRCSNERCCARVAFRLIFCQVSGSRSTSRSSESRASPARAQSPSTLSSDDPQDDDGRGQRRTPSPLSDDASVNSADQQNLLDSSPVRPSGRAGSSGQGAHASRGATVAPRLMMIGTIGGPTELKPPAPHSVAATPRRPSARCPLAA